ncbi:MAG: hypothetical protein A4E57_04636 [Syntrophorhabdaceae bacterium PtaU1.Bin034]|nr:MAG: hypothetical protein A4E57_04636 [Syntrophorhabdaceae bacterium PtaU1.Bin034]
MGLQSFQLEPALRLSPLVRLLYPQPVGHIKTRDRFFVCFQLLGSAAEHQVAPVFACSRAQIEHIIRAKDGIVIVFDYDNRVAQVPKLLQSGKKPFVVPLVKADARLIEHVEHPGKTRADLGREPDPLRFP